MPKFATVGLSLILACIILLQVTFFLLENPTGCPVPHQGGQQLPNHHDQDNKSSQFDKIAEEVEPIHAQKLYQKIENQEGAGDGAGTGTATIQHLDQKQITKNAEKIASSTEEASWPLENGETSTKQLGNIVEPLFNPRDPERIDKPEIKPIVDNTKETKETKEPQNPQILAEQENALRNQSETPRKSPPSSSQNKAMVKTPGNGFINKQQVENTTNCTLGNREINAWTFYDSVIKQSNSLQYMAELLNNFMNSPLLTEQLENLNEDSIVFAVTVHTRVDYLHEFVESLRRSKPENSILVIYHHSIDQAMMDYVRSIDFIAVKQLIFPHSRTMFPHSFPGESPNDCTRDSKGKNCVGNADKFQHFREELYPSLKLQWVWLQNYLWRRFLPADFKGFVLLFEEDHVITNPDFMDNFKILRRMFEKCSDCIGVGMSPEPVERDFLVRTKKNIKAYMTNVGLGFCRKTYEWFRSKLNNYCDFDDYNWDVSLYDSAIADRKYFLIPYPPQAEHVGCSGVHVHTANCQTAAEQAAFRIKNAVFTPLSDKEEPRLQRMAKRNPNGGFGDRRDVELCKAYGSI